MKLPNHIAPHTLSSTGIGDSDNPRPGYAAPWLDRLLARWEVSQFGAVPFCISIFATHSPSRAFSSACRMTGTP